MRASFLHLRIWRASDSSFWPCADEPPTGTKPVRPSLMRAAFTAFGQPMALPRSDFRRDTIRPALFFLSDVAESPPWVFSARPLITCRREPLFFSERLFVLREDFRLEAIVCYRKLFLQQALKKVAEAMAYVYLSGRNLQGLLVTLQAPALPLATLGSSGAGLSSLALQLGGMAGLRLLASKAYVQLLKGFGAATAREKLACSWLTRLGVPAAALLSDLGALGGLPCTVALFDVERQAPVLFGSHGPNGGVRLAELVAALCSLLPSRLGALHFVDLECVLPAHCIIQALQPPPFFVVCPREPSLSGGASRAFGAALAPAALCFSARLASLQERLLGRGGVAAPVFSCRVPHTLELWLGTPSALLNTVGMRARSCCTAAVLIYVWACVLCGPSRPTTAR